MSISFTEDDAKILLGESDQLPDDKPPMDGQLICENCGTHFEHSGRGRKPKKCPDCRATKTASTSRVRGSSADVKSALATLDNLYNVVAIALLTVSPKSASVWAEQVEGLQASNAVALAADKNLCRSINRLGERTGKAMFFGAHIMALAPVAITLRADMAARKPKKTTPEKPARSESVEPAFEQPPANNSHNLGFFE